MKGRFDPERFNPEAIAKAFYEAMGIQWSDMADEDKSICRIIAKNALDSLAEQGIIE